MTTSTANSPDRIITPLGTHSQAASAIAVDLGVAMTLGDHRTSRCVAAELLRSTLWRLSDSGRSPIYTTRLIHAAEPAFDLLQSSEQLTKSWSWEEIREELLLIGDICSLRGGWWLPGPGRAVPIGDHKFLLIGGLPTGIFSQRLECEIEFAGLARMTREGLGADVPRQPLQRWCGLPDGTHNLAEWAQGILEAAILRPIEEAPEGAECYAPTFTCSGSSNPTQYHRWASPAPLSAGRFLMRTRGKMGTRYSIVRVAQGSISHIGNLLEESAIVRRLMYGLDALAGKPVRVTSQREGHDQLYTFRSALPEHETRLFTAIGYVEPSQTEAFYPIIWRFASSVVPQVMTALEGLQVQIREIQ